MTHLIDSSETISDPSGSIFLPKASDPEREFQDGYFELLLRRKSGYDKEPDELNALYTELVAIRRRQLGNAALG